MKIVITESQYKKILREEEEQQKVLHIPSINFFDGDWDLLQKFLKSKGNPPYSIGDDLFLEGTSIQSLGNLTSVRGYLDLSHTDIQSLGNLKSVGGNLFLRGTPLSKIYTSEQIRQMVNVGGEIFM